ncbi:hypothetical protein [Streptomyces sp. NPDC006879]|uniref:hypothetical protein n=1 Tax=Streptomyces sp. NPDC006879 TaxID=3364767 RepID=UPI0036C30149
MDSHRATTVAPVPVRPEPAVADRPPHHEATTTEQGSFCLARCTCGWRGPARRSRDRARQDAVAHTSPVS